MKHLERKYRRDELSPEELKRLRETMNSLTDEEIEQTVRDSWTNEEPDVSGIDTARMNRMKRQIDRRLGFSHSPRLFFIRAARTAAAILLLLFACTTLYLYHENRQGESENVIVSTDKGERANVTLPDGSQVTLNVESMLSYTPKRYNKDERQVSLEGEAFFRVKNDGKRPFHIAARDLCVTVLGTTFNLLARKNGETSELTLEEGSVRLVSLQTGEEIVLKPHQTAILNHSSRKITVLTETEIQYVSAWKNGELVFRNTPLTDVMEALQENYGISIETDCEQCLTDLFTGTITNSNLNEALDILEKTCHFKATLHNRKVRLIRDKQFLFK
ncbi:MAG: FecR domain-containing protein [Tannerella sp.]|jgi:ferric-dicitrate binding protein FerR (iron transport regulator)|nr:FecR domain-containing protein [Tannerella sp.]